MLIKGITLGIGCGGVRVTAERTRAVRTDRESKFASATVRLLASGLLKSSIEKDEVTMMLGRILLLAGLLWGRAQPAHAQEPRLTSEPLVPSQQPSLDSLRQSVKQLQIIEHRLPPRERWVPHRGLFIAGWTLFGIAYAPAVLVGSVYGGLTAGWEDPRNPAPVPWIKASRWTLLLPVAGPFVSGTLGMVGSEKSKDDGYDMVLFTWTLPLILDGIAQLTGVALIAAAYTHPLLETIERPSRPSLLSSLRLQPYASPSSVGFTASGSF